MVSSLQSLKARSWELVAVVKVMAEVESKDCQPIVAPDSEVSVEEEATGEADAIMSLKPRDDSDEEYAEEDDDDEDEDLREWSGGRVWRLLRSRGCLVGAYLLVSLAVLASAVAVVVVGVLVALPYSRTAGFRETRCTAVRAVTGPGERRCSCGKGCHSAYPCLTVHVILKHMRANDSTSVILYENETTLKHQCSYFPSCKSSQQANEHAVQKYLDKYGKPGVEYSCLYNPRDQREAVRTRRFHKFHVVHGMLWSSTTLILSCAMLLLLFKHRPCYFL